jgi:hypothetical protein
MVNDSQNYWGFGLFPSSGILPNRGYDVSETGSVSVFRLERKTHTQLGPLERANLNHWFTFPKRRVLCYPEFLTMKKVQKPSNSKLLYLGTNNTR